MFNKTAPAPFGQALTLGAGCLLVCGAALLAMPALAPNLPLASLEGADFVGAVAGLAAVLAVSLRHAFCPRLPVSHLRTWLHGAGLVGVAAPLLFGDPGLALAIAVLGVVGHVATRPEGASL